MSCLPSTEPDADHPLYCRKDPDQSTATHCNCWYDNEEPCCYCGKVGT